MNQGSLYPALQRVHTKGLMTFEWRITESYRRARDSLLTEVGERQFASGRAEWERSSSGVSRILAWDGGTA